MDEDWDLQAVVRGCTAPAAIASSDGPFNFTPGAARDLCFEPAAARRSDHEELLLHEIYKPFMFKSPECSEISISPQNFPIINSPLSAFPDLTTLQQQRLPFTFSKNTASHNHPTPKPKKRKNHMKRVCHVAAENLSSDVWSWRKYGQKPIKGSPYPRGYYRCSTSKGCLARKQVERNRSDPEMFIVTYTADHNHPAPTHRNSLAGSTRHKQPNSEESAKSHSSTEKMESSPEEGESEMCLEDDFFDGLEDLVARHSGHFSANVGFSWLSTTVAGGN